MADVPTIDITSPAFALRLANLLVASREENGQGRLAVSRSSQGRFSYRDLREFEKASRALDEITIDELAQLYRCDLGAILPPRLPVTVTADAIMAGGVRQSFQPEEPDALLLAYLELVRTLRRQKRTPVVALRRDDLEVLASHLHEPRETVLHRLATLMNATQRKRAAMTGVLATGAVVIGLVGAAAALNTGSGQSDTTPTTVVTTVTTDLTSTTISTTVTTTGDTTLVTEPVTVLPTVPPTIRVTTTKPPLVDINLPTTTETTAVVSGGSDDLPIPP